MLKDSEVAANIPAADLERARTFYADMLGLMPADEYPGGYRFKTGTGTVFYLYETEHAGKAEHTIAQFHVPDVAPVVEGLKANGVVFEHYDLPGMTWDGDIAEQEGVGHAAWFKDSEANILCIDDMTG